MKPWIALSCAALLAATTAQGKATGWVSTWGAAPEPPGPALGPLPATPSFASQTIRQIVRISAGGERVRVRFSNEYGTKPLTIGEAHVAVATGKDEIQPGTDRVLTFAGKPTAVIPAGAPLLSDPVDLPLKTLSSLSISIFLPDDTGPCTCHLVGMATAYVSSNGDFTDKVFTPDHSIQARAFLTGVEVSASVPAEAIVVLGDSISDGVGSTADANRRWPDLLADRLDAKTARKAWGVANLGISGNRLLNDGMGQSALTRFDRDVLSVPGAGYVIIFLGVNDLGFSFGTFTGPTAATFSSLASSNKVTAEAMVAGYRQLIARAHERGLKVIGATITPYEGADYYSKQGEAVRQTINQWIRTGGAFDGVLDFDRVLRDPAHPSQITAGLHAGDHLHGSDAGYQRLANSIDLSLFK